MKYLYKFVGYELMTNLTVKSIEFLQNSRNPTKSKKIQENDCYSRILIRSTENHRPPPLALGTFNENPCAKTENSRNPRKYEEIRELEEIREIRENQ